MNHNQLIELAAKAHNGQTDKAGHAYIFHPLAVADILQDIPTFNACTIAQQEILKGGALLHDVVEDTDWTVESLREAGVDTVTLEVVSVMTHTKEETREDYIQRVAAHPLARIVKLADIAHNTDPKRLEVLGSETEAKLLKKYRNDIDSLLCCHPDDTAWMQHERPELFN
jgi:(p)ppGpp synthase/HD superfamily hydrolase